MKYTLHKLLLWLLLSAGIVSCEKYVLSPDPDTDPFVVFDYLWDDINNRYTYFEEKKINWDSLGGVYRKQVARDMSDQELFRVLGNLLYHLKDGHVNLTSSFDRSRNWAWFEKHHINYNQNIIDRHYLGTDFFVTGPLHNKVIDSVLYLNYRSFSDDFSEENLEMLMKRAEGLLGVIIDIRHNGGGKLVNASSLAACFTDRDYEYASERIKTGPGSDDYSVWRPLKVVPRNGARFSGPVVVLTNRKSYSAASFFAQMMRVSERATLLGDTTGGGGGIPVFGELPNGWKYRFSASQTVTPEGEHLEFGVPVDVGVRLLPGDEQNGIDTIIETALDMLGAGG